eukprot:1190645-Prorocentrum_minimum.AAC.2
MLALLPLRVEKPSGPAHTTRHALDGQCHLKAWADVISSRRWRPHKCLVARVTRTTRMTTRRTMREMQSDTQEELARLCRYGYEVAST